MAWKKQEAQRLSELSGYFWVHGVIAVLDVIEISKPSKQDLLDCPEGYRYKWAVLSPGIAPKLCGPRAAGVDNAADANVRAAIQKNKLGPKHVAHRHYPEAPAAQQANQWPVAGPGVQLLTAPASPGEFWLECMDCLEGVLTMMGLSMPSEVELIDSRMTEAQLQAMETSWSQSSGPTP